MRPLAGVIPLAFERFQTLEIGHPRQRQIARSHDTKPCIDDVATIGRDSPVATCRVVDCRFHSGLEPDITPQIEAVSDMIGVTQYIGLSRETLRPFPLLLQLVRKRIGILQAFNIAAGTRIAIPVPGAAHALTGFEDLHRQLEFTQPMKGIHAGKTGADDHDVKSFRQR